MKKDGFIFMESLTVLVVVLLATTLLLSSYSLFIRKSKEKESYNLPSDRYLLFNIAKLNATVNEYFDNEGYIANRRDASYNNPNSCEKTPIGNRLSNCKQLFKDNDLVYFIVIKDIKKEMKRTDITTIYDSGTIEYLKTLERGLFGYLKQDNQLLQAGESMTENTGAEEQTDTQEEIDNQISTQAIVVKDNIIKISSQGYIVGVFYKNGTYRYAAIPLYQIASSNQSSSGVLSLLK